MAIWSPHHQGASTCYFDVGPESGLSGPGAGDDPGAEGQPVRLQNHGVSAALLLMSLAASGSRWTSPLMLPFAGRPGPHGSPPERRG